LLLFFDPLYTVGNLDLLEATKVGSGFDLFIYLFYTRFPLRFRFLCFQILVCYMSPMIHIPIHTFPLSRGYLASFSLFSKFHCLYIISLHFFPSFGHIRLFFDSSAVLYISYFFLLLHFFPFKHFHFFITLFYKLFPLFSLHYFIRLVTERDGFA